LGRETAEEEEQEQEQEQEKEKENSKFDILCLENFLSIGTLLELYWNCMYWNCIGTLLELYVLELYWNSIGTVCIGNVLEPRQTGLVTNRPVML